MRDVLGIDRNYASLSTRDLLDARDQYHWHLVHKRNVIGTAIGLYHIRKSEEWPTQERSARAVAAARTVAAARSGTPSEPRTFENSEVREYSWPCVLVLVHTWVDPTAFGTGPDAALPAEDMVPNTLYLPDGRTVPVCVIKVDTAVPDPSLLPAWTWPKSVIGGGFPLISSTQGVQHTASVGDLVTDGHSVYAVTSRHVAGPPGHPVSTILGGHLVEIGRSSHHQLTRRPFTDVYPDFPGRRTFLTLDAALVEVSDVNQWTSQVYGLPPAGELADLSEHNIGLKLINARVVAYGAASGQLRGRIAALFYRHRSIGGYDDVTDFLIAPDPDGPSSQPGDSGTVWHLIEAGDTGPLLRPIALQWGGQGVLSADAGSAYNFALATGLTNVLRLLDVDLVVDFNTGPQPFWGKTGHYSLATFACGQVTEPGLRTLLTENVDRISFPAANLAPRDIDKATKDAKKNHGFVPLADVADVIWKNLPSQVPGGRDTSPRSGPEHPTHYADIDEPRPDDRQTLRGLSMQDPDHNVTVPVWQSFYDGLGHHASAERGLLPFRVWQFFTAMIGALTRNDLVGYLCAAGLMAHYVGDACQSLHGSMLADGLPDGTGKGVHSAYETSMIDHHAAEIVAALPGRLQELAADPLPQVDTGQRAAAAVVALMDRTARAIDPASLVRIYAATRGGNSQAVTAKLWQAFSPATITILADGARTLAMIWESAWILGNGPGRFSGDALRAIDRDTLQALYENPDFVPSLDLDHIAAAL